jgi:hypothetical protein
MAMTGSEPRLRPPAARFRVLVLMAAGWLLATGRGVSAADEGALVAVGVAEVDITPAYPVRMTGYGNRKTELEGVEQRINARALAIGGDARKNADAADAAPFVLVTVENCGVPAYLTEAVAQRLEQKAGIPRERFVVSSTHTHTGPALRGVLGLIFGAPIPPEHQERIDRYTIELTDKIEQVAHAALDQRRPGRLAWGQGSVAVAVNRRQPTPRGVQIGVNSPGPVDHALPLLRVTDADGAVRAVLINYACHCTSLGGDFNKICGDWAGYACEAIERSHPGAIALVTIGCGADANPKPRGSLQDAKDNGAAIAREAERLLQGQLVPLPAPRLAHLKRIEIPFGPLPTRAEWEERAGKPGAEGLHARTNLARLDRGEALPTTLPFVVQTWCFGDDLAMVFLAGEVVVDYARRLKAECDGARLWISAYSNDVPCYIASRRVIGEGGYEVDASMRYYDRPTRLDPEAEDRIIAAVKSLLPEAFLTRPR